MPAWLKPLLDLLLFLFPAAGEVHQGIVVAEDIYPIAVSLQAWVVSPAGQKVIQDMEALAKGTVTEFSAAAVTASAKAWKATPAPPEVGGKPSGTNHGGLMWPPS